MVLRHNRPEVPFIPHILSYFVINYKMQPADPPPPSMYTCLLQSGVAAPFIKKWFPLLHFLAPRLVLCDYLWCVEFSGNEAGWLRSQGIKGLCNFYLLPLGTKSPFEEARADHLERPHEGELGARAGSSQLLDTWPSRTSQPRADLPTSPQGKVFSASVLWSKGEPSHLGPAWIANPQNCEQNMIIVWSHYVWGSFLRHP